MPTSNKTANLNLNNWLETDKPKRIDFVENNNILDNVISTHLANTVLHLTSADRELLTAPFVTGIVSGTGEASHTHTLSITPKFVIFFLRSFFPVSYDATNGYTVCNGGIALKSTMGSTPGLKLVGNSLTVTQSQGTVSNGVFFNLNKLSGQYLYIAFK